MRLATTLLVLSLATPMAALAAPDRIPVDDALAIARSVASDVPASLALAKGVIGIRPGQERTWEAFERDFRRAVAAVVPADTARRIGLRPTERTEAPASNDVLSFVFGGAYDKLDAIADLRDSTMELARSLDADQVRVLEKVMTSLPWGMGAFAVR